MSQQELAERVGVLYQAISQWERGVRSPKYQSLLKIADALDIDVTELITGTKSDLHPQSDQRPCAIWQGHNVIGYIGLTKLQRDTLNAIPGIGCYFGSDPLTNPEMYSNTDDTMED